jgi:hypothetical protein
VITVDDRSGGLRVEYESMGGLEPGTWGTTQVGGSCSGRPTFSCPGLRHHRVQPLPLQLHTSQLLAARQAGSPGFLASCLPVFLTPTPSHFTIWAAAFTRRRRPGTRGGSHTSATLPATPSFFLPSLSQPKPQHCIERHRTFTDFALRFLR